MVEHAGKTETDTYFADGYYGSVKMLFRALSDGVKGRSVTLSYDPVTQKLCVHMKSDTTFMLYGDLPDILGFGRGDGVVIRTSNRKTLGGTRGVYTNVQGGAAGPSAPLLPYSAVFELSADAQKKHTWEPHWASSGLPSAGLLE